MARRRSVDRHTRIVSALKVGLPLAGLALLASVVLLSLRPEPPGALTFSAADLEAMGSGLKVTRPRFSGASLDGDLYDFEAATVVPTDAELVRAEIEKISGAIRFADGLVVNLTAPDAAVDLVSETIFFDDGLVISTSSTLEAAAARANLDLRAGVLTAEGGVSASGTLGTIVAERLRVETVEEGNVEAFTEGATLVFTGGVELRYVEPQIE
ncbi:MAG: hypothetical protein AAF913_08525 [Pseudomonadota bacterium]